MELNMSDTVQIGHMELSLPEGHGLGGIYASNQQYQRTPWAVIAKYSARIPIEEQILLDLGCNIGDSIAHFRVHSDAEVLGVEASRKFYDFAEQNLKGATGKIRLINALVVDDIDANYDFIEGSQTGHISKNSEFGNFYTGEKIGIDQIVDLLGDKRVIYKSDLDGFDTRILSAFYRTAIENNPFQYPIIFIEGPTEGEMKTFSWHHTFLMISKLIKNDYEIVIFTNRGDILRGLTSRRFKVFITMFFLTLSMHRGKAFAHYLDFLAVHNSLIE